MPRILDRVSFMRPPTTRDKKTIQEKFDFEPGLYLTKSMIRDAVKQFETASEKPKSKSNGWW